jgi:hypothetical protein
MGGFLLSMLELCGVVFLRFRPIPRLWCVWLVGVNAMCLYFITHLEAQIVLAVSGISVMAFTLIYQRIGFTRVLGSIHVLWVPMFAWMATRIDANMSEPPLACWLVLLLATNMISLVVDAIDTVRFLRGERAPHYRW